MCRGSCLSHVRWGRPRNTACLLTTVSERETETHNGSSQKRRTLTKGVSIKVLLCLFVLTVQR